ncbi:MAG: ATP synthase F1 subunit gamma [Firmicutes bacterium]|nr:ATP synthase F1 subunit gamma [Bacillota bacterium]HOB35335.1 ATP synthase F1 subunit gamma [Bacillota bacterium]HPZ90164.1 ATP synthase F1 subunit gamma [Bacillota bacterium]HQE01554.1 ATP synthase F1 subunit gamma [Bacillota bacterium]
MENTRDIKRRITSVRNIQQITKAMEMVAAAKLRRAQASVLAARPYMTRLAQVMSRILQSNPETSNSLLESREGPPAYIVIAADRGLCGAYNTNVLRFAREIILNNPGPVTVVGRKAKEFMRKRSFEVIGEYGLKFENPTYKDAAGIMGPLFSNFAEGIFGSLHLIYTEFVSVLTHRPKIIQLLPVVGLAAGEESPGLYLYEPSPAAVLDAMLPRYVTSLLYQGLLEAKASELGAQRAAMKSATDNANEMIDELTLSYNRARQAAITREILEVVNGAQALEG